MLDWLADNMVLFWVILAVIFAALEGTGTGVAIWFTIGSGAAAAASALGAPVPAQVIIFFAVGIVLLIFARPLLVEKLKVGREKNYTEQLEGKPGLVVEAIEQFGSGQVKVRGIVWTSVGETDDFSAPVGSKVEIVRVEGVKLVVKTFSETGEKKEGE